MSQTSTKITKGKKTGKDRKYRLRIRRVHKDVKGRYTIIID